MQRRSRVHPRLVKRLLLFALLLAPAAGCASGSHTPDAPVPSGEPRAVVRLQVDLVLAQDCEETFDLALYARRAVELVEWDGARGRCADRTLRVRYLPRQISREEVIRAASAAAEKVAALPDTDGAKQ